MTAVPAESPGAAPPAYQPSTVGRSGSCSAPDASTPTGTSGTGSWLMAGGRVSVTGAGETGGGRDGVVDGNVASGAGAAAAPGGPMWGASAGGGTRVSASPEPTSTTPATTSTRCRTRGSLTR